MIPANNSGDSLVPEPFICGVLEAFFGLLGGQRAAGGMSRVLLAIGPCGICLIPVLVDVRSVNVLRRVLAFDYFSLIRDLLGHGLSFRLMERMTLLVYLKC